LRARLGFLATENLLILFLDTKSRLIAEECVSRGTVSAISVYPRQVVLRALELGASSLVMAHNHPSNDSTPSKADIQVTRRITEAGRLLEISVRDHIIVGTSRWTSMRALGVI
jgi:DNA repair protein RadC